MAYHQTRVTLRLAYHDALALCVQAVSQISGCTIDEDESIEGVIVATTPMNWKTFGDRITVTVSGVEAGRTQVHIHSATQIYQWYDYGRNAGHIQTIAQFLNHEHATLLRAANSPPASARELLRAGYNDIRQDAPQDTGRHLLRPGSQPPE